MSEDFEVMIPGKAGSSRDDFTKFRRFMVALVYKNWMNCSKAER